jgi:hypothetical protein
VAARNSRLRRSGVGLSAGCAGSETEGRRSRPERQNGCREARPGASSTASTRRTTKVLVGEWQECQLQGHTVAVFVLQCGSDLDPKALVGVGAFLNRPDCVRRPFTHLILPIGARDSCSRCEANVLGSALYLVKSGHRVGCDACFACEAFLFCYMPRPGPENMTFAPKN